MQTTIQRPALTTEGRSPAQTGYLGDTRKPAHVTGTDEAFDELCSALFTSLRRNDQRRKGMEYILGLLGTRGRKSVRNMAALIGGNGTEQSLHHFVSGSTWDWTTVRRALAQYVMRAASTQAWVVRPLVIPKTGQHSVGVSKYFSPTDSQVLNAQWAIGVWAVSDQLSVPLNWRLHLPRTWITDQVRRSQASIPSEVRPQTPSDCVISACREMRAEWELPARPVVVNTCQPDAVATVCRLRAEGMWPVARIADEVMLTVADPALTGHVASALPASQIMRAARELKRPVGWLEHASGTMWRRTSLIATVRVTAPLPHSSPARPGHAQPSTELLLVGVGDNGRQWPAELWLTSMTAAQAAVIPQLSGFSSKVDQDFAEITDQVGIKDYAGRSYSGWHRHVTLVSAAHAIAAMSAVPCNQVDRAS
ncbi:IS701 family transposase [Amycolatopsis cihanbeyliensis]|uniref:DDE superfamily endonuclease n=1 Tax=Amycolatopsis cihanbeyliensis TaxID=1128664 RepID=A0A542DSD8_AMYCI|nr:transposase [Amycolatopsis cihanbeyliensis]TQJ05915.1 DDE superfamily endonuclease [Amycolatopsis cihanbeyliensis]